MYASNDPSCILFILWIIVSPKCVQLESVPVVAVSCYDPRRAQQTSSPREALFVVDSAASV
jgi:hypothetical protein